MRAEVDRKRGIRPANFAKHPIEHLGRGTEPAVCLGNVHPHESKRMERLTHRIGKSAIVIVLRSIDIIGRERSKRVEHHRQAFFLFRRELRKREDEIFANFPEREPPDEGRIFVRRGEMRSVGRRWVCGRSHAEAYSDGMADGRWQRSDRADYRSSAVHPFTRLPVYPFTRLPVYPSTVYPSTRQLKEEIPTTRSESRIHHIREDRTKRVADVDAAVVVVTR